MASLLSLASTISTEADRLASYLKTHNLPNPSFAFDGPPTFPVPLENEEMQASRMKMLTAAQDLAVLTLGPVESLRWQAWNVCSSFTLAIRIHYTPCCGYDPFQ